MINGSVVREIRFRDGHMIPKGDSLIISWPDPKGNPTQVHHRGRILNCTARSSLAWIGLTCSGESLAEAMEDGTCETPNGNEVEPDGVDPEGAPSWLMIYGLI
jgi:hypothetical protein